MWTPTHVRPEIAWYVMPIADWNWTLSFGVTGGRRPSEPYTDFRHLQLRGTLLQPRRVNAKSVELTLMPDARLNRGDWPDSPRPPVGSLTLNLSLDRLLQGLLPMPADALEPVLVLLSADRVKFVVLDGDPLRHRRALIGHYRLEMSYDEKAPVVDICTVSMPPRDLVAAFQKGAS
jgi:hypothetical protein